MSAILLRLARRDDLDANAELEEPDRELGETRRPARGEGRAAVGTNRRGQAELEERGIEDRLDVLTDLSAMYAICTTGPLRRNPVDFAF